MERYLEFQKLKLKSSFNWLKITKYVEACNSHSYFENPAKKFAGYVMSALEIMKKKDLTRNSNIISAAKRNDQRRNSESLDANEDTILIHLGIFYERPDRIKNR